MDLSLPKRIDGEMPPVLKNVKQITVIGANGAGKTLFSRNLLNSCINRAYKMSALKAIFPQNGVSTLAGSIDMLFVEAESSSHFIKANASTEFDKLMFMLLHDEFLELLKYKSASFDDDSIKMPQTKLDRVVKRWQEIFPKNKIWRESGKLLFSSDNGGDVYPAFRLSDGEKAVLYYLGSVLYAMPNAVIFVEEPGLFIHRSMMTALWNVIEQMRPDCTFIYNTHDVDFVTSRLDNKCIWVKEYDALNHAWDYDIVGSQSLSEELYLDLLGSRNPILFIEGDEMHSIDSKLYSLVFTSYTIKPLGSCNKVIESTRSFNSLTGFHHLDSYGIVDRDRRDDKEVEYLRKKKILVPNVAEIENILMLPDVIYTVASYKRQDAGAVLSLVKNRVIAMFKNEVKQQALEHVRHRVKRAVEYRIDRKFTNITALENHMVDLVNEINPRLLYNSLYSAFNEYINKHDYYSVLRVFNDKTMLSFSSVATLCGLKNTDDYIHCILTILKEDKEDAKTIRTAIKCCFGIPKEN